VSLLHDDGVVLVGQTTAELALDMFFGSIEIAGLYLPPLQTAQHYGSIYETLVIRSKDVWPFGRNMYASVNAEGVIYPEKALKALAGKGE
jgi:hypothetical protein